MSPCQNRALGMKRSINFTLLNILAVSCSFGGKNIGGSGFLGSKDRPLLSAYGNSTLAENISQKKLKSFLSRQRSKIKNPKNRDRDQLQKILSASSTLMGSSAESFMYYHLLSLEALKEDIKAKVSDIANLNMAVNALRNRRYGNLFYFLDILEKSQSDPVVAAALNLHAIVLLENGEIDKATENLSKAYSLDSESVAIRMNYASVLVSVGKASKALKVLEDIKNNPYAQSIQVVGLADSGEVSDAREICQKLSVKRIPATTLINCGVVNLLDGKSSIAKNFLAKASRRSKTTNYQKLLINRYRRIGSSKK